MKKQIKYTQFQQPKAQEISHLIKELFDELIAPEFSEQGREEFLKYIAPEHIAQRQGQGHFIILAKDGEKIVGMIEIRDYNHISLLFVDKEYQHQGISRNLFEQAKEKILHENSETKEISVNSSTFALKAYEHLGFKQTGEKATINGITFIPMRYLVRLS